MISWILRLNVRSGVSRKFFTTCCVIVDAPCLVWPARRFAKNAREHAAVVDAAVRPEVVVLGRDERIDDDRRDLVVRHERAALA